MFSQQHRITVSQVLNLEAAWHIVIRVQSWVFKLIYSLVDRLSASSRRYIFFSFQASNLCSPGSVKKLMGKIKSKYFFLTIFLVWPRDRRVGKMEYISFFGFLCLFSVGVWCGSGCLGLSLGVRVFRNQDQPWQSRSQHQF